MVGMHHSITTARWLKRSMRRTTRSSSRWGFRFPWKPDLPRLSPLGQGHPVPAYLPPFPSSRGISHNRCVFTFPSSAIFPFSPRGENSRKMRRECGKIIRRKKIILVPTRLPRNTGLVSAWFHSLPNVGFLDETVTSRRFVQLSPSVAYLMEGGGKKGGKLLFAVSQAVKWLSRILASSTPAYLPTRILQTCFPIFCGLQLYLRELLKTIGGEERGDSWSDN